LKVVWRQANVLEVLLKPVRNSDARNFFNTLWRDAVDMKIPLKDEFKIHFMNRRQSILQKMTSTASAWSTLLRGCQAEGEDKAQLEKLQADVAAFQKWTDDGLKELTDFAGVKYANLNSFCYVLHTLRAGRMV
jgi:hypothetical protein